MVYFPPAAVHHTGAVVNLPRLFSTPKTKTPTKAEIPFVETVKHDLNTTVNEAISYSALYFLNTTFKLEQYIFQPGTDSDLMDALKSAGIVVTCNEALRLAKRMGWSFQVLK